MALREDINIKLSCFLFFFGKISNSCTKYLFLQLYQFYSHALDKFYIACRAHIFEGYIRDKNPERNNAKKVRMEKLEKNKKQKKEDKERDRKRLSCRCLV